MGNMFFCCASDDAIPEEEITNGAPGTIIRYDAIAAPERRFVDVPLDDD